MTKGDLHSELTVSRPELLKEGTDATFRSMLHDLLAFSASLEAVRGRFGAFLGVSGIQYTLVVSIRQLQGKGGVGVKDLAEHLGLSAPFVTTETKKLVRLGIVAKATNPDDLRRVNLTLTDQGRKLLLMLAPMQREINDAIFEPLAAEDMDRLVRMASDLRRSAERAVVLADYLLDSDRSS